MNSCERIKNKGQRGVPNWPYKMNRFGLLYRAAPIRGIIFPNLPIPVNTSPIPASSAASLRAGLSLICKKAPSPMSDKGLIMNSDPAGRWITGKDDSRKTLATVTPYAQVSIWVWPSTSPKEGKGVRCG